MTLSHYLTANYNRPQAEDANSHLPDIKKVISKGRS